MSSSRPTSAGLALVGLAMILASGCEGVATLAPSQASIRLFANPSAVPILGTSTLSVSVTELSGQPVPNGTRVSLTTTSGRVEPEVVETDGGFAEARFEAGTTVGTTTITANSGMASPASITVTVGNAAMTVNLSANPNQLPVGGGRAVLTATVLDAFNQPVPNVAVSFSTDRGVVDSNGIPRTTDGNGSATDGLTTTVDATVTAAVVGTEFSDETFVDVIGTGASSIELTADPASHGVGGGTSQIVALVKDRNGNPVDGIPVAFTANGGSLSPLGSQLTDASGRAGASLTTTATTTVSARTAGASGTVQIEVDPVTPGLNSIALDVSPQLVVNPILAPTPIAACGNTATACSLPCVSPTVCCRYDLTLTATVRYDGEPVADRQVTFSVDRLSSSAAGVRGSFCEFVPQATSDADGIAVVHYSISIADAMSCQSIVTPCFGQVCPPAGPMQTAINRCCCGLRFEARSGTASASFNVPVFAAADIGTMGVKACNCAF